MELHNISPAKVMQNLNLDLPKSQPEEVAVEAEGAAMVVDAKERERAKGLEEEVPILQRDDSY